MLTSFVSDYTRYVLKGGTKFYAWMGSLALFMLGMLYVFYLQNTEGLIVTGMTSQIHDGLYFANLVFLVGVAAGAVTIVFPGAVAEDHQREGAGTLRPVQGRFQGETLNAAGPGDGHGNADDLLVQGHRRYPQRKHRQLYGRNNIQGLGNRGDNENRQGQDDPEESPSE